jgi:hypothetical protein
VLAGAFVQSPAHGRVGGRQLVQAFQQGLEVQQGAAHQQRQAPARPDLGHQARGVAREIGGAVGFGRLTDVDQVVRHGRALGRRGLGGADVQAAIDQGRVDADDFHRHPLGQRQRQRALAAGRGPARHSAWIVRGDVSGRAGTVHPARAG